MPIRAGKLKHRVEVQARTVQQDTFGDAAEVWTTLAFRWASIEPEGGREVWQADQQRPDVSGTITIRSYRGLTPKHRIKWGSRIFNLESVTDLGEDGVEMRLAYREEV